MNERRNIHDDNHTQLMMREILRLLLFILNINRQTEDLIEYWISLILFNISINFGQLTAAADILESIAASQADFFFRFLLLFDLLKILLIARRLMIWSAHFNLSTLYKDEENTKYHWIPITRVRFDQRANFFSSPKIAICNFTVREIFQKWMKSMKKFFHKLQLFVLESRWFHIYIPSHLIPSFQQKRNFST